MSSARSATALSAPTAENCSRVRESASISRHSRISAASSPFSSDYKEVTLKRAALFLGIASGFFFIANPIYIKHDAHPLMANGRPFASAHFVNGQWAIPLEDFARLGGSNVSLEPNFKLQGNMLIGLLLPAVDKEHKHLEASASSDSVTSVSAGKVAPAPVQQKG